MIDHGAQPDRPATDTPPVVAAGAGCACGPAGHRSRRDVLAVAAAGVVGAGLLDACGGSGTAAPTSPVPTTTVPTPSTPVTAAPDGFSVPASVVPVGGGTIYPDEKLVITQPTKGTFKAFSAVCPHQGCIVAAVDSGQIRCACHASAFDDATGARLSGPAQRGLTTETVTVTGSTVTVAT